MDFVLKHYKDLTPFLKTCNKLTLSPDFMIPQELIGEDEVMTHSTIVDSDHDQPLSWSSASSGSENNLSQMACTSHIVRKKRTTTTTNSGYYNCSRSSITTTTTNNHEDISTSYISRRKGIPHRSPLY